MKAVLLTVLACAVCCAQPVTIVNSGSTNTAGFRIVVDPSGEAQYTLQPRRRSVNPPEAPKAVSKTIATPLVKSLFADVNGARPLSSLPVRGCVKSVSFGTRLTIEFDGETSPDLSCGDGGNQKMKALIRDATQIVKLFRGE